MTPCPDCRIENRGPRNPMEFAGTTVMDLHIVFCPLHAQAEAMREVLRKVDDFLYGLNENSLSPLKRLAYQECVQESAIVLTATQEPRR